MCNGKVAGFDKSEEKTLSFSWLKLASKDISQTRLGIDNCQIHLSHCHDVTLLRLIQLLHPEKPHMSWRNSCQRHPQLWAFLLEK